jgi:hypothetical protein
MIFEAIWWSKLSIFNFSELATETQISGFEISIPTILLQIFP